MLMCFATSYMLASSGCMDSYAEFILHHYAKLFMMTELSFEYHQHVGCVTRFLFAACVYVDNDVIVIHAVINGMRGYV